jgi:ferredoxin
MKVAVIGSGAAAAGVLAGLERYAPPGIEITLFDIGQRMIDPPRGLAEDGFTREQLSPLYRTLHAAHGLAFPPPKSHFGQSLTKLVVEDRPLLWKSEHRGGLTNVWGGGMFPFTDRELAGWPISAADLDPYYRCMADKVGVCGEADELNQYFHYEYSNRPPLRTSPVIDALRASTNRRARGTGWRIVAGASRLALETRGGLARSCTYSGECMLGCPREAIWSAGLELDHYQARSFIARTVLGRVQRITDRRVHYLTESGNESAGAFDRIYLAAGCIGSTEIVMRSLGLARGPTMLDNAVESFPILYAGAAAAPRDDGYFSLCNLSMMGIPDDPAEASAQVSVYPAFDHLFRYYTPEPLWSAMRPLWRRARWRFLLGRVFLAGVANRPFSFELVDDALVIRRGTAPLARARVASFMRSLRATVNHGGFYVPPVPPTGQATSSHYAATFPYGGSLVHVPRDGEIAPGLHLADASTFVTAPAISPTFTIMANACRTVHESLHA